MCFKYVNFNDMNSIRKIPTNNDTEADNVRGHCH